VESLLDIPRQALADHVNHVINSFFPDVKMMRSPCHDGAANMVKASRIIKVDYYQHCFAHSLHLLLTVDTFNDVPEVQTLLLKCRNIVTTLHFKSYVIEEELVATADCAEVNKLFARISAVSEVAELDNNFPVVEYDAESTW